MSVGLLTVARLPYSACECGWTACRRRWPGATKRVWWPRIVTKRGGGDAVSGEAEIRDIEDRIRHLEDVHDVLEEARGEFDHEIRRNHDALVRAGGRAPELEREARRLGENRDLAQKDLEKNRAERRALQERLAAIVGDVPNTSPS